ncbi:hypothetical protein A3Q56_06422 [Intoshia linei]|uniref:Uncharacterized protein n=1 Tax=Intoshia linei TaxID=1819745 RepID=A0A177AWS0_9BILA|nr:hypothetical protein A3Q56_06422 [Intoshia linei]
MSSGVELEASAKSEDDIIFDLKCSHNNSLHNIDRIKIFNINLNQNLHKQDTDACKPLVSSVWPKGDCIQNFIHSRKKKVLVKKIELTKLEDNTEIIKTLQESIQSGDEDLSIELYTSVEELYKN